MRTGASRHRLRGMPWIFCATTAAIAAGAADHATTAGDASLNAEEGSRPILRATVINGTLSAFPAVVRLFNGGGACSATLVSPQALVTAAHCINRNGGAVRIRLDGGRTVRATCEKSPGSLDNPPGADGSMSAAAVRADVAACKLDEEVPDITPACVGRPLSTGSEALLVGFGVSNNGSDGISDGRQRQGRFRVLSRVSGLLRAFGDLVGGSNTESALGPGDSGGFAGSKAEDGRLFIAGINSAGSATVRDPRTGRIRVRNRGSSLFADLMSPTSQTFLSDFARRNGVQLCGVNAQAGSPPSPGPGTPPRPNPPAGSPPRPNDPPASPAPGSGALIAGFSPRSFGQSRLGLRPGDRLEVVGDRNVRSASDAVQGLRDFLFGNASDLRLRIRRADGSTRDVTLRFPPIGSAVARQQRQRFRLGVLLRNA